MKNFSILAIVVISFSYIFSQKQIQEIELKPTKDILTLVNEELSKKETGSDLEFYKFVLNPNQVILLNNFPIYFMEGELEEKQKNHFSFIQPTTLGNVVFVSKSKWSKLPINEKVLVVQNIIHQIQRELANIQLDHEFNKAMNNKDILI